jgi:TolB-like protein
LTDLARLAEALADHYTIEREVGRGGMATVYLGQDRKHRRPLAIKVLHPELAVAVGGQRFLREIEIAAQLNHPHILPLYDSGEAAGFLYYVMPYVEGETLRQRVDRERQLPVGEAVRIAREVADGLSHAHGYGVIHRDIKPENILISGGHAVIADFGIARAISAAGGEKLTGTGFAMGTPAYMSPEQALGERQLDARSDLYSLGCVLYEMLVGEPPHTGPTAQAIIARRVSEPVPSAHTTRETVPQALDAVLRRGLARVPADRYATAAAFSDALSRSTTGPEWVARPAGPARVMGLYLVTAAAVLALVQVVATQLGLPRWVVPGALVLLLIGIPVILATTFVQRGSLSVPGPAVRLLTWRRAILGGVLAFGAWGVIVTVWGMPRSGDGAPPEPTRLAVLPFSVLGDSAFAYLGEGIVDLLARNLDGTGDLRTVDPGTVLSALGRDGSPSGSAARYRAVARRVGAGNYLVGTVHAIAGRLRIQASLYDATADSPAEALSQLLVEGEDSDVLALVDQLAARLLVDRGAAPGRLFETATLTTGSLQALKTYLTAEQILRSGPAAIDSALAGFQRAVAEDTTFALAWYRLAVGAGWQGRQEMAAAAAAAALRHSARLADRDRRLLEAYDAYRSGSVEQAEQGFRSLVRDYPDDLEAEFQLADLLTNYNPLRGRSQDEARELFDRILAWDPGFL